MSWLEQTGAQVRARGQRGEDHAAGHGAGQTCVGANVKLLLGDFGTCRRDVLGRRTISAPLEQSAQALPGGLPMARLQEQASPRRAVQLAAAAHATFVLRAPQADHRVHAKLGHVSRRATFMRSSARSVAVAAPMSSGDAACETSVQQSVHGLNAVRRAQMGREKRALASPCWRADPRARAARSPGRAAGFARRRSVEPGRRRPRPP